jgi:hypothetical protein
LLRFRTKSTTTATTPEMDVEADEAAAEDDQDAAAEVEAEAVDGKAAETDQPVPRDHQHIAGRTEIAHILVQAARERRQDISIPPPTPTCRAAANTAVIGSEIWGQQLAF